MPFTNDEINNLFDPVLTVDAGFSHAGGPVSNIKVIFDNDYQRIVDTDDLAGVESSMPTATCKTADIANAKHGDTLNINGTTYYITEIKHDGNGITIVMLSRNP